MEIGLIALCGGVLGVLMMLVMSVGRLASGVHWLTDVLGGVLLGIIEIFAKAYISTQLSDAIVFAVLIVVLIVRPAGLLGKQVREKV